MLEAHAKREAVKLASEVKHAMVGGLWANPNYDDNKQTRKRALQEIESNHREIIGVLYGKINQVTDEDLKAHPFFAPTFDNAVPAEEPPILRPHDQEKTRIVNELDQT